MHQRTPVQSQLPPERVELTIQQPKVTEIYYSTCGKINQHNRRRADTLMIDKKIETKQWDKRINLSILGMIFVDSFLVYKQLIDVNANEGDFYALLAEEMIDNNYDSMNLRWQAAGAGSSPNTTRNVNIGSSDAIGKDGRPRSGVHIHLTLQQRGKGREKLLYNKDVAEYVEKNFGDLLILQ